MEKKDCAFQYATRRRILEDTNLITEQEAEALFEKYILQFKQDVENGDDPEMAIWIEMSHESHYHKTSKHWCGQDFIIRNGQMFSVVPVA